MSDSLASDYRDEQVPGALAAAAIVPAVKHQQLPILPAAQIVPASGNVGIARGEIAPEQVAMLMRDLKGNRIAVRDRLSYLEAWDVKAHLTRIFGFGGYSSEVLASQIIFAQQVPQARDKNKINWKVAAQVTLRLTIHQLGAVFTEVAIGGSSQPDFTESADMSVKTAESDALKRAAIALGTQFGLSLYNEGSPVDVVKVIVEPNQAAMLVEMRERAEASRQGATQQGPSAARAADEATEEFAPAPPSAQAQTAAQSALQAGFGGGQA